AITFFGNDPRRGGRRFVAQGTEGGGWGGRPVGGGGAAAGSGGQGGGRDGPIRNLGLEVPMLGEERGPRGAAGRAGQERGGGRRGQVSRRARAGRAAAQPDPGAVEPGTAGRAAAVGAVGGGVGRPVEQVLAAAGRRRLAGGERVLARRAPGLAGDHSQRGRRR